MNINLLDPSLYCRDGHQAEWAMRLARVLRARGHMVRIYSHAQTDATTLARLETCAPARALFRITPYLSPHLLTAPAVADLHLQDGGARSLAQFIDGARLLVEDLREVEAADLHIWVTFNSYQLHAISQSPARVRSVGCIHELPTFYDPAGNLCWRYAWLKARDARIDLRTLVTVPELLPAFGELFDARPLPVWPICVDGRPQAMRRLKPQRIGFFGKQRNEKGMALIEELARALLDRGHEVVLQDGSGAFVGGGIERLTLLGFVEDIVAEISRCDLVVAPYDPVAYAARGSGVVWESLASGVPVVVPANTAPARFALGLGAGKSFDSFDAPSVLGAVAAACDDFRRLAKNAYRVSQEWPQREGVERSVDALLARE